MADFAAVWPANRGADTLRGGLLYHRYSISGVYTLLNSLPLPND